MTYVNVDVKIFGPLLDSLRNVAPVTCKTDADLLSWAAVVVTGPVEDRIARREDAAVEIVNRLNEATEYGETVTPEDVTGEIIDMVHDQLDSAPPFDALIDDVLAAAADCSRCGGSGGGSDVARCPHCSGRGRVR